MFIFIGQGPELDEKFLCTRMKIEFEGSMLVDYGPALALTLISYQLQILLVLVTQFLGQLDLEAILVSVPIGFLEKFVELFQIVMQ